MNPLYGKLLFKLRLLINWVVTIAVFVALVLVLPLVLPTWIADAVSIAIAFYLYFFILDKRAIGIRCPHCRKYIATNTPWMCGFCQKKNESIDEYPFVNRCEHCGAEPKAYQCHHEKCGKLIFLTEDELLRNYAYCINPPPEQTEPTVEETERSVFETDKRRAEYKLHLTRLNTEVELAEQAGKDAKKKTQSPEEKIGEHRAKRRAKTIIATEIYQKELKANAEKYKDDPDMLKMVNEDLEDWYKGGDWERLI